MMPEKATRGKAPRRESRNRICKLELRKFQSGRRVSDTQDGLATLHKKAAQTVAQGGESPQQSEKRINSDHNHAEVGQRCNAGRADALRPASPGGRLAMCRRTP